MPASSGACNECCTAATRLCEAHTAVEATIAGRILDGGLLGSTRTVEDAARQTAIVVRWSKERGAFVASVSAYLFALTT
jgi:hypothetical protein